MIAPPRPTFVDPASAGPFAGRTLLLIEDEGFIAELLIKWLGRLGAKVLWANTAAKAVELFEAQSDHIWVIIADFRLPDSDGCALCTQLRELKPRVPVLLTSGRYQDSAEQALMITGPTAFIQKPYSLDEVSKRLLKLAAAG